MPMTKEERAERRRIRKVQENARLAAQLVEQIAKLDGEDPWATVERGARKRLGNFARRASFARC